MARARRHTYFMDGERKVAEPIHPHWYTARGVLELNERLRAPPVSLHFRSMAKHLPASARRRLTSEVLRLAREVMLELFDHTRPHVLRHLRRYPIPEFDPDLYSSPGGRAASERYLEILRGHSRRFVPRAVARQAVLPGILVFGTSRSAESLRMHALFGPRIAWDRLENQRGEAHADYCLDITATGAVAAHALLEYWWEGRSAADDQEIQEAYDTVFHEGLHRVCDLGNPFGPQYGPKGSAKEHYWMQEYEPFASAVERVLVAHLSMERERGLLKKRLLGKD